MEHGIDQAVVVDARHDQGHRAVAHSDARRQMQGDRSHSAAPSRSSTLMAVCGSLMPGDSARTATSTNCRTANSRSPALAAVPPRAVALRIASSAPSHG